MRPQQAPGKQATSGQQWQPHVCYCDPFRQSLENPLYTVTSWTKVIPQAGRTLSFTATSCSSAMGREVKQIFASLGQASVIRVLNFLPSFSGKCHLEVAQGRARCHRHTWVLHRSKPLQLHFSRSTNCSGRQRHSCPDEQRFWCSDSASEQEAVESHSHPAVPPRARRTNAIVPPPAPPPRFRHVLQAQPPGPSWPGGGREQTQTPTSTRELISLF